MDYETDVDPRWATGPVTFVERPSPNVAVYTIGSPRANVALAMQAPNQVVVLRGHQPVRRLVVTGQKLPNGSRLRIEPTGNPIQVDIKGVALAEIDVRPREGSRVGTLTLLYAQLGAIKIRDVDRVDLRRHGRSSDPIDVRVGQGDGDVVVNATSGPVWVSSVTSKAAGRVTLSAPLTEGAAVETRGDLAINAEPPMGSTLEGANVTVAKRVGAATIRAPEGQVTMGAGVAASADNQCRVFASAVIVEGEAVHLRVEDATTIVAGGSVRACDLTAASSVSIRGAVQESAIEVTASEDGALAVVAGGEYDPDPDEDPLALDDEGVIAPLAGWAATDDAEVRDSNITVEAGGTVVISKAIASTIRTNGTLLVAEELREVGASATNLRCAELDTDLDRLVVPGLVLVEADATVSGQLESTKVIVQGTAEVPSSGSATITADHVQLAGRSTGALVVTCKQSLYLGKSDDRPAIRLEGGPARLLSDHRLVLLKTDANEKCTTVALEGRAGEQRSDEPDIVVEQGATGAIDVLQCSGELQLANAGDLRVVIEPDRTLDLQLEHRTARAQLTEPLPAEASGVSRSQWPSGQRVVVDLDSDAVLSVERRAWGRKHATSTLRASFVGPAAQGGEGDTTAPTDSDGTWLSLRTDRTFGNLRLTCPVEGEPPAGAILDLTGPVELLLDGGVRQLWASPPEGRPASVGDVPVITLADRDTRVSEAHGDIAIREALLGRLHGPEGRTDGGPAGALRIVGLDLADGPRGGAIIGFDPTEMGYEDLHHLEKVQVVDAHPAALRRFAREKMRMDRASRARLRARAEWMAAFLERTSGRATAGSSRAATRWATNRLHHRSLTWGAHAEGTEKLFRYAHEALGCSSKVWPPLVTWLLVSAAVVGARIVRWGLTDHPIAADQAITKTVLLPLSFLRLGDTVHVFVDPVWNTLAFVVTAVPLVYLLIAVRNVLREPGSG